MDSGNQFLGGIGFCHIIIGARIEGIHLGIHAGVRGQVNHRNGADFSHLSQDFMTAFHRFIGVKDNNIRLSLACQVNGIISGIVNQAGEARFLQLQLHETAHTGVMFNN